MLPAEVDLARDQAALTLLATVTVRGLWRRMGTRFDPSWERIVPAMSRVVASTQVGAARNVAAALPAIFAESAVSTVPLAALVPEGFGAQSPTGNSIGRTLESAKIRTKQAVEAGASPSQALDVGEEWLDNLVRSIVQDTARDAAQAATTATPRVGFVRVAHAPCCSRCAVLAGRWYPHSTGFRRHPRCDCGMRPAAQGGPLPGDVPDVAELARTGGIRDLTRAQRESINQGASPEQVINATRRGAASGMTTTEGTSRKGYFTAVQREYARQSGGQPATLRLTPGAIQRLASDRQEAVRLLARNGYITDVSIEDAARLARP